MDACTDVRHKVQIKSCTTAHKLAIFKKKYPQYVTSAIQLDHYRVNANKYHKLTCSRVMHSRVREYVERSPTAVF